ncbi:MAG: hypothetical protein ACOCXR_00255 [Phototrophicaceae bacterium]
MIGLIDRQFSDNIIARAEFKHQRFVIRNSRSGTGWIVLALLMLLPALIAALVQVGGVLLGVDVDGWSVWQQPVGAIVAEAAQSALIIMNVALYFVLHMVGLGLAYASITREHSGKTWDVLLLTDVSARTLVMGKWRASLRALWGDHLLLVALRLGLLATVLQGMDAPNAPLMLLIGGATIIAFTLIDAALTVALGVGAALAGSARSIFGPAALITRLTFIMFITTLTPFVLWRFTQGQYSATLIIALGLLALWLTFIALALSNALFGAVQQHVSPSS